MLRRVYSEDQLLSRSDSPIENRSPVVDKLLLPIVQQQKLYLRDTSLILKFLEQIKVLENTTAVSIDVTTIYTDIPQEEGIE